MAKNKPQITDEEVQPIDDAQLTSDQGGILASWEIPEFTKHERKASWFIYFSIALVALLAYSYYTANPLFAIIIVLFVIIFFATERGKPKTLVFAITPDGIMIANKLMAWRSLQNFYIIYYPPRIKNLYFQPKNSLRSVVNIPLETQNPVEIRQLLLQFLPEDLQKEEIPTSEGISHLLKL